MPPEVSQVHRPERHSWHVEHGRAGELESGQVQHRGEQQRPARAQQEARAAADEQHAGINARTSTRLVGPRGMSPAAATPATPARAAGLATATRRSRHQLRVVAGAGDGV
jgi:hypothetical protein